MILKNPKKEYRAMPFWSWNGKLEINELKKQAEILEEMGFGGAFLHSRCGLQTEYMSKEWLSLVEDTATYFFEKNMQSWLYDEDRWPSGSCGGLATEKKENRQKALSMYIGDNIAYGDMQLVGVFAIRLTGDADKGKTHFGKRLVDYKRLEDGDVLPDGYEKATFVVEFIEPSDFYNGNTYLDTMNKKAVQDFLSLTHEKYKNAFGEKFGKEIKGIFLDEPHRGGVFNGFNITNKNAQAMLPWSYEIFHLYMDKFAEQIEDKLPELYFMRDGETFNKTIWRYLEVLQTQFIEAFAKPYQKWCKNNNLLITGHVWDENTLLGQITWQGSIMRFYEFMDIPGIDNLRDDNYFFAAPLQAVSVAKQTGKKEILSEMYACTGWKTTFDYYKRSGDWQALLGINVRCPHLSWYTMGGEAKRDCPASIFFQAGWYKEYKYIEDYFARLKMTFGEAEYLTDVLLLSPIESGWGLVRAGAYANADEFRNLESEWRASIDELLFGGVDFDIADEDILSRKAYVSVERGVTTLVVGKMRYKTIVLPPIINIRASTLHILQAFSANGGNIVMRETPSYVNGEKRVVNLKAKTVLKQTLVTAVKELSHCPYSIDFSGKMLSKLKKIENAYLLFVIAFDCIEEQIAKILLDGKYTVQVINLRTGEYEEIDYKYTNGKTVISKAFVKGEELLLVIDEGQLQTSSKNVQKTQIVLSTTKFDYELNEPNVLPLDYAKYSIDDEDMGYTEFLKIDKAIREKFGLKERSANNRQPWFEEKFNENYHKKLGRVRLEYTFNADILPTNAYLMLEDLPNASWEFNGEKLTKSKENAFVEDICFSRYDLPKRLFLLGINKISVAFDFTHACNLETVYLAGSFAVNERALCEMPKKIRFGDICTQGFPFYTGKITYKLPVADGVYDIEHLDFGAACVASGENISAFMPFVIKNAVANNGILPLSAILLRRNLWGPLHEIPKNHGNYWSGSYRTENEKFTDEYQINQQGIFSVPKIYKRNEKDD